MSRPGPSIRLLALPILLVVGLMAGCTYSDTITGPDLSDQPSSENLVADGCPDWGEVCDTVGWAVWSECPLEWDWKNQGQLMSCKRKAMKQYLAEYKGCFSTEELDELKECILLWTPLESPDPGGDTKTKITSE